MSKAWGFYAEQLRSQRSTPTSIYAFTDSHVRGMMEGHDVPFDYEAHAANIAKKAEKTNAPQTVIKEESSNMNTISELNKALKKEKGWTGIS